MNLDDLRLGKDKFYCIKCATLQVLLSKPTSGYVMDIYGRRRREIIRPPTVVDADLFLLSLQCINCGKIAVYPSNDIIAQSNQTKVISNLKGQITKLKKYNEIKLEENQKLATALEKRKPNPEDSSNEVPNSKNHLHYG